MGFGYRNMGVARNVLVATVVAIIAITMTVTSKNGSTKSWDDTVLKDLARFYHQRVFLRREETSVVVEDATTTDANATSEKTLDGIVILVTGSTSGIGRSLVRWAYKEGATVLAMGRSITKLHTLRKELEEPKQELKDEQQLEFSEGRKLVEQKDSGNDDDDDEKELLLARFFPIVADMSDLNSVSTAVDVIRSQLSRATIRTIDIVVCNAGIVAPKDATPPPSTEQGYELTFGVNYLSHFLLTEKLMHTRIMEDSDYGIVGTNDSEYLLSPMTSRIVQVSSSLNMAVDGTALAVVRNEQSNIVEKDKTNKLMFKTEKQDIVDGRTNINYSPVASRVRTPGSASDAGFFLNFLESRFRNIREYGNSKLAQLLHARISNRKFLTNIGSENKVDIQSKNRVYVPFVSACPGWVGTHILRSTIQHESWQERLFHTMSFDVDGYGLSSILRAMFAPLSDLYDEKNNESKADDSREREDYFSNFDGLLAWSAHTSDRILVVIEFLSATLFGETRIKYILSYVRDILVFVALPIVMGSQRFFTIPDAIASNKQNHEVVPNLATHKSSSASYNRTLQRELYEWSLAAIADFL